MDRDTFRQAEALEQEKITLAQAVSSLDKGSRNITLDYLSDENREHLRAFLAALQAGVQDTFDNL
jgi:hypothetical protein